MRALATEDVTFTKPTAQQIPKGSMVRVQQHPDSPTMYLDEDGNTWSASQLKVEVAAPLTIENIQKWAEKVVAEHPTREEREYDLNIHDFKTVQVPRTVEWQLARLLLAQDGMSLQDQKTSELAQTLLEWQEHGIRGYKDYSKEELLKTINENLILDSPLEAESVEELLEILYNYIEDGIEFVDPLYS